MGTHFPAARLAAAVSSALALSMLVPLGGGTPASAAAASSLQAAFNNVGISTPTTASAGNFDGIGDSFAAAGLASDALVPGQSLLHDGLRIDWPDVPTFGSLLGAQLVDLYIHAPPGSAPAGETQSTAAAGAWNYSIAPADAWNQLIEVDGFGTDDWVTPGSASSGLAGSSSLGSPQVSVAQLSPSGSATPGLVTITVPASALGTPSSGWTFTVTLTGQDGFGNDDARAFTATPGSYTFGVCSAAVAGGSAPPAVCSADPASVPLVMDTIPPAAVNVQTELDPTANPSGVVLQGVTVP